MGKRYASSWGPKNGNWDKASWSTTSMGPYSDPNQVALRHQKKYPKNLKLNHHIAYHRMHRYQK